MVSFLRVPLSLKPCHLSTFCSFESLERLLLLYLFVRLFLKPKIFRFKYYQELYISDSPQFKQKPISSWMYSIFASMHVLSTRTLLAVSQTLYHCSYWKQYIMLPTDRSGFVEITAFTLIYLIVGNSDYGRKKRWNCTTDWFCAENGITELMV